MLGCIQPMSSPMMNRMLGFLCCGCCTTADFTAGGINIKSKMPTNETFLKLTFISLFPLCRHLILKAVLFCCDVSGIPKAHVVPPKQHVELSTAPQSRLPGDVFENGQKLGKRYGTHSG